MIICFNNIIGISKPERRLPGDRRGAGGGFGGAAREEAGFLTVS
jgi:hypothetical protein